MKRLVALLALVLAGCANVTESAADYASGLGFEVISASCGSRAEEDGSYRCTVRVRGDDDREQTLVIFCDIDGSCR